MLRTIIERLSRNIVLRRRLPAQFGHGPVYVSPGAALNYWHLGLDHADPMLLRIATELIQKGDIVWDIGANVGIFAFAAAHRVANSGKVLAIEPNTWLVSLLRRSATMAENRHLQIDVLPVAISESVDIARFNIAKRGRATNHLNKVSGSTQTGGIREQQLVPTLSLDWILDHYPAPNFIKIDVEGAECMVVKGAHTLLSKIKPVILCEVFSENAAIITSTLKQFGYTLFDASLSKENRKPMDFAAPNTIAYPTSTIDER